MGEIYVSNLGNKIHCYLATASKVESLRVQSLVAS